MRTVTYKSVLDRIAGYMGEAGGLHTEDVAIASAKINLFVRLGWQMYWWPDTMAEITARTFRAVYDGTAVVAGDERFFPADGQYYQALQASTGQAPALLVNGGYVANAPYWAASAGSYAGEDWVTGGVYVATASGPSIVRNPEDGLFYQCIVGHTAGGVFDPTKFAVLTPFVRSLEYAQAGETALGLVRFVWDRNPEVNRFARPQKFRTRPDFIQVLGCANVIFPEFQLRVPVFTSVLRDDTTSYGANVTLYDTETGDCWTTKEAVSAGESPTSAPSSWDRVAFPEVLAEYVAQSAYAMMTDREQETPENFSIQNAAGYPLLVAEMDNLERKQGQTRQLNVQTGVGR